MRWLIPAAAAAGSVLVNLFLLAQGVTPQEIQFSASQYFPRTGLSLQTEARLVDVGVVVRDDRGRSVNGLGKDDFQISDNGKRQEISSFAVQLFQPAAPVVPGAKPPEGPAAAPLKPRFVSLVFDDLSMSAPDLQHAKIAAKSFLKSGLAVNDRVGVLTLSEGMVQQFTTDTAVLAAAIDNIASRQRKNDLTGCPSMREYEAFLIANELDRDETDVKAMEYANCNPGECSGGKKKGGGACARAYSDVQSMAGAQWQQIRAQSLSSIESLQKLVEFMAKQEGTRMVLLASSGFLSGTLEVEQDMVIERALHANVVIDALDSKGLFTVDPPQSTMGATARSFIQQQSLGTRPQESTNDAMNNLADATGGLFFHNSNDLELGFREVGMQPETSYLLAFTPPAPDSKYHHLKVTLAKGGHEHVQARLGYMSVAAPAGKALPERPIDHEVLANTELKGVAVQVLSQADKLENGKPVARLAFVWDVAKMPFRSEKGAHAQTVHLIWCLLDANGNFVTGKEGVVRFALTDATYQKVLQSGLTISGSLEAAPGSYRLRTVVSSDESGGRISSFTQAMVLK